MREKCWIQTLYLCHKDASHAWWRPVISRFVRILLLLQEPDFSRDSWFSKLPHTEHGTRERTGREAIPAEHRNARAPHMNQSLAAATGARQDQIFLQLLDGSTIPYCTLRPEIRLIGLEICRLTNMSVYHQLLTLEGRELHTGDNIPPNSAIILGLSSRGGTRSHGQFQCLDVLASVFQTSSLKTMYEQTLIYLALRQDDVYAIMEDGPMILGRNLRSRRVSWFFTRLVPIQFSNESNSSLTFSWQLSCGRDLRNALWGVGTANDEVLKIIFPYEYDMSS